MGSAASMNRQQKRQFVRQQLNLVALEADKLKDGKSIADSSIGLVGASGGSGGRSGKTSDLTAVKALSSAMESVTDQNARNWYGLVSDVYVRLCDDIGKAAYQVNLDREIALVFYDRVICGKRINKIAQDEVMEEFRVSALYSKAVDRCVRLAESRGMIP